jgi:hypothetical protein
VGRTKGVRSSCFLDQEWGNSQHQYCYCWHGTSTRIWLTYGFRSAEIFVLFLRPLYVTRNVYSVIHSVSLLYVRPTSRDPERTFRQCYFRYTFCIHVYVRPTLRFKQCFFRYIFFFTLVCSADESTNRRQIGSTSVVFASRSDSCRSTGMRLDASRANSHLASRRILCLAGHGDFG